MRKNIPNIRSNLIGLLLIVTLFSVGISLWSCPKIEPAKPVTHIVLHQDTKAVGLLSLIMGHDCSDIAIMEMGVVATAYTARAEECNSNPEVTADMTPSRIGLVAVSRDLLEKGMLTYGQRIIIPQMGVFVVADTMNKRFKRRIDILHANVGAARLFGKKDVTIIWLTNNKETK